MSRSLQLVVAMVAALLAALVLAVVLPVSVPGSDPDGGPEPGANRTALRPPVGRYVALGDSFTAGPFIPYVDASRTTCLRSSANYPAILGGWVRARTVVDVSCSGAETVELAERQLRAVTRSTDLVTLGVGGNDFALFGSLVSRCPAVAATDPTGSPCREAFTGTDGTDLLLSRMPQVQQRVAELVDEVAQRAPDAAVAVVGYPRLVPGRPSGTCPELPFAAGDYRWADRVERGLNAALAAAARGSGAVYVDTYGGSRDHDACAGAQAWVNGQGTAATEALAYHPYADGMVGSASAAYEALTGQRPTRSMTRQAATLVDRRPPGTLTLRGQRVIAALLGPGPGAG